jgi:hypothetical protein
MAPWLPVVSSSRLCPICGKTFSIESRRKYCSQFCKDRAYQRVFAQVSAFCPTCGLEFLGRRTKKYCSKACWPSTPKPSLSQHADLSTGTVGAIAELAVCHDLLRRGYAVFRSVSPNCYCDLIARRQTAVLHVEVRTGYTHREKLFFSHSYQLGVTCMAIWDRNLERVYYFVPGTRQEMSV